MNNTNLTAYEARKLLKSKEVSSAELTTKALRQITENNEKLNFAISIELDYALKMAESFDKTACKGVELNSIQGLPIAVKDNICTVFSKTTCASRMLKGYVSPYNATVIDKLSDSIITAKLNMDEFAMGSTTETSYFGAVKNPHDSEKSPGGSSGGCAAAVAVTDALMTLGSDTGGSIRLPSSHCGVVGLKPTYGSVSRYGLIAFASSLDQIGPICKSVKDTAMLYDAICGHDKRDLTSIGREYPSALKCLTGNVRGLKIGIPDEYFTSDINKDVKTAIFKTLTTLEKLGAELIPISLKHAQYALSAYYIISSAEASSNLSRFDGVRYGYRSGDTSSIEELFVNSRTEGFGDEVKRRILLGTFVLSEGYYDKYYLKAKQTAQLIKSDFKNAFSAIDVIATPVSYNTAPKLNQKRSPVSVYSEDFCTVSANLCGIPAISVPCGFDKDNMPIGIQFMADSFREDLLLNTAYAVETELNLFPWARRESYVR